MVKCLERLEDEILSCLKTIDKHPAAKYGEMFGKDGIPASKLLKEN